MSETEHMEGVYQATKKNGEAYYRASLTYRRRHISLGSYKDALLAHLAYRTASRLIMNGSTVTLEDYRQTSVLSFEKWVILLNFRDNGIYLGTPIYIRPRFFFYYLSPNHVLKFDTDDLFYYASHKIMCRGSHYFVADYGMQVNIASRYGIKNYAVPGVDFDFLNGDTTDFRRENLQINNAYHGVRILTGRGSNRYSVRIHVNGYYKVGVYDTIIEAAIAYNKAADILRQNGLRKNFLRNYIEDLSPAAYANIYSALPISAKIVNYFSE
ncbi:MAG: hypothetical protein NC543_00080 [bacterium]|nr:hypothetical protein [bacterium]MCM1376030.1 hypothetical protein [Muribaculum sp.]